MSFKKEKQKRINFFSLIIYVLIILGVSIAVASLVESNVQGKVDRLDNFYGENQDMKVRFFKIIYNDHKEIKNKLDVQQLNDLFNVKINYDQFVNYLNSLNVLITKKEYEYYKQIYIRAYHKANKAKIELENEKRILIEEFDSSFFYQVFLTEDYKKSLKIGYKDSPDDYKL